MCTNFQTKETILNFSDLYLPKSGIGGQNFENISLDLESATFRYCVHIFRQCNNFEFLGAIFPKIGFWTRKIKNLILNSESAPFRQYVQQLSDKTNNFEFSCLNFPQKRFCGPNFKKVLIQNQQPSDSICTNFKRKLPTSNFLT